MSIRRAESYVFLVSHFVSSLSASFVIFNAWDVALVGPRTTFRSRMVLSCFPELFHAIPSVRQQFEASGWPGHGELRLRVFSTGWSSLWVYFESISVFWDFWCWQLNPATMACSESNRVSRVTSRSRQVLSPLWLNVLRSLGLYMSHLLPHVAIRSALSTPMTRSFVGANSARTSTPVTQTSS
ncbi:hypothetical protein DFH08DRAFT_466517 [Mycena albidolilacea]|uniref:Uncharacterized protein n=1 Tax=Mycena albidolilacea TaxID=1033008 RepID=A0AAD7AEV7_9AGAR|nr:hypothetical protein DFH08DRAFT_466517 [Mycena albidolilacea]